MTAVERLRRDHTILRVKLRVLESALRMGPNAWYALPEVCFTLARQLDDHIRREEDLVAACRRAMIPPRLPRAGGGMTPKVLAEVAVEHKDEPEQLRTIIRLFGADQGHTLERIRPALEGVIAHLRRHMLEEERELFPILERTLVEAPQAPAAPSEALLDETMTVNRVIHDFPYAQPVFERLFISVPVDGDTCLDEVAWRHGMDAKDLLARLEQAIGVCGCAQHTPHHEPAVALGIDA